MSGNPEDINTANEEEMDLKPASSSDEVTPAPAAEDINPPNQEEEAPPEPVDNESFQDEDQPASPEASNTPTPKDYPPVSATPNSNTTPVNEQDDAMKNQMDAETGQAKMTSPSAEEPLKDVQQQENGERPKPQKQESKREKNDLYKDVEKTGKWGNISKGEKIAAAVFVIVVIVAVVVTVVLVSKDDDDKEPKFEVVPADTPAPTPMATAMPPKEKFPLILKEIYDNPVTASVGQSLPDDPNYYVGKIEAGGCAEAPQECAMSWALYEDDFPPVTDNIVHRYALASLYHSMGGPSWTNNTNWLTSTSYCQWHGIKCNRLATNVEDLDLVNNNLQGKIPLELSLIDTIIGISMKENKISGGLPGEVFASLPLLFFLYIEENLLTGPIPDNLVSEEGSLAMLQIHGNNFTGPFPAVYCEGDEPAFTQFSLDCSKNECPAECCLSENCF